MAEVVGAIQGDLLKWAREQQELTMRWVQQQGGPGLGYQSEVENMKKREVRSKLLAPWVAALQVTEAFARGHVPKYNENPKACRGLAGDIFVTLKAESPASLEWPTLSPTERVRRLLNLCAFHSKPLPRIVLAHVLSVELRALDDMLTGAAPIPRDVVIALCDLTTVTDRFVRLGELQASDPDMDPYRPVVQLAESKGITPDILADLVRRWNHGKSATA